jgi:methyl-accepting chemotaxis protein
VYKRQVRENKLKLTEVVQSSRKINTLISSISIATVAQAKTARAVTQLMQQVTVASEERCVFSNRMASSMQATSLVAKKLEEKVAQFKV